MNYFEKHKLNLMIAEQAAKGKHEQESYEANDVEKNVDQTLKRTTVEEPVTITKIQKKSKKSKENDKRDEKREWPKVTNQSKDYYLNFITENNDDEMIDEDEEPTQSPAKKNETEPSKKIHILHKLRKNNDRTMRDFQQDIIIKQSGIKVQKQYEAAKDGQRQKYNIVLSLLEPKSRKIEAPSEQITPTTDFDDIMERITKLLEDKKKLNANISANALEEYRYECASKLLYDMNKLNRFMVDVLGIEQDHNAFLKLHEARGNDVAAHTRHPLWKMINQSTQLCLAEAQALLYSGNATTHSLSESQPLKDLILKR
jgi:hypothetical protein